MRNQEDKPKRLSISQGDQIKMIKSFSEGLVNVKEMERGKIVYTRNQVSADVWLYNFGTHYDTEEYKALKLGDNPFGTTKVRGVVLELDKKYFAVVYKYEKHGNIRIRDEVAELLPYCKLDSSQAYESNWYRGDDRGLEYSLEYLQKVCNAGFEEYVRKNLKFKRITKQDREDRHYPESADRRLTDESLALYETERKGLELAFATTAGVYVEFLGGLIED